MSNIFGLNNYLFSSELGGINSNIYKHNEHNNVIRDSSSNRFTRSLHTKNKSNEIRRRIRSIDLSVQNEILSAHNAPVYHLDIDKSESRYLLACGADGSIAIYDILESSFNEKKRRKVISSVSQMRRPCQSLTRAVTDVQWFPFDTGMFFSGATEGTVDVWDTNKEMISRTFNLENSVNAISFSALPSTQLLIAVGTSDQKARLCDIRTGMSTHCLSGHRESILAIKWSPYSPFHLVTGSKDKTIRLWDIRRSDNFLMALDQHNETTDKINRTNQLPTNEYQQQQQLQSSSSSSSSGFDAANERLKSHRPKYFNRQGTKAYSISSIKPNDLTQSSPNMAAKVAPFAHNGFVTSLVWSHDGQFLYSTGSDKKIRRWDMQLGTNTFVDFPAVYNSNMTGNQMCLSYDGNYLFHPNGKQINMYDANTGDLVRYLKGHFERVNCCVFHPHEELLLSGANDRNILVWDPSNQERTDNYPDNNNNNNQNDMILNDNNNINNNNNNNNNNDNNNDRSSINYNDFTYNDTQQDKRQQEIEYNQRMAELNNTNNNSNNNNNSHNNNNNNNNNSTNQNLTLPDEDRWSDDED